MMTKLLPTLVMVLFLAMASAQAEAGVIFGYDVNSSPQKAGISFNDSGGDALATVNLITTVDLSVNYEEAGTSAMFDDARLRLDATATNRHDFFDNATYLGTLLHFSGSVTFTENGGDDIVTFDFVDSSLFLPPNPGSGSVNWSSSSSSGSVTTGNALSTLLNGNDLTLPGSFAFTLTRLNGDADAFVAQSSFSADTSVVPEPSTGAVLLGLSSIAFFSRRRR